jgi:hypothetical protein
MKRVVASLIIGACLLLPSGGLVLARDPHLSNPSTNSGTGKGQPGSNAGVGCEVTTPLGSTPGNASMSQSPFNEPMINTPSGGNAGMQYAGSGANTSTPANSAAVSEYDVACLQHTPP